MGSKSPLGSKPGVGIDADDLSGALRQRYAAHGVERVIGCSPAWLLRSGTWALPEAWIIVESDKLLHRLMQISGGKGSVFSF